MKNFKGTDFGSNASINVYDNNRTEPTDIKATTFTCSIRNIPINLEIEILIQKIFMKTNLQITNARRMRNNNRDPLPLFRLFTKDPALVIYLLTNGITIGYTRYRVGESRNTVRTFPCRHCMEYHGDYVCSNKATCMWKITP